MNPPLLARRAFLRAVGAFGLGCLTLPTGCSSGPDHEDPGDGPHANAATPSGPERDRGLILRGGRIPTSSGSAVQDLLIRGEKIAGIGGDLAERTHGLREIDVRGLEVLPGGVDPHVHLSLPDLYARLEGEWLDDFRSGSMAALAGGVTTVGNVALPGPSETILDALTREEELVRRDAVADFALHPVLGAPTWSSLVASVLGWTLARSFDEAIDCLPDIAARGHTSIKFYMNHPDFDRNLESYRRIMAAAGRAGMLTMIHCEDASILARARQTLSSRGRDHLRFYEESRPVEAEIVATRRAIRLCEETGAPTYIVHLSSGAALRACRSARERGLPVFVETRPLYLHFSQERYRDPDGPLYVAQPPLRTRTDVEALWEGLADGAIDTIGSDHAPWTRDQKLSPDHTIDALRAGVSNLQEMLPVLYSEGVHEGRITLERFVEVTSTNAARLLGLFPEKGRLAPGADADVVVFDPGITRVIRDDDALSRSRCSVYHGLSVTGWPRLTIRRGEVLMQDGRMSPNPSRGRLAARAAIPPARLPASSAAGLPE